MSVVGTRPEIIRLSRVFAALDVSSNHTIVHTGQNFDYELSQVFFDDLGVRKPDFFLNCARDGVTLAGTIGNLIKDVDMVLDQVQPEAVLLLGDTNSCLSVIPAKRRKIPIFHMEAGNRCFDQRVPEEINRRIVDHTADINLTYSSIAREYLLREGFPPDQIIKTGSPMYEVLNFYLPKINNSKVLKKLKINSQNYFLISAHREENIDNPKLFSQLVNLLNMLALEYNLPVLVSTHPRTRKKFEANGSTFSKKVNLLKPLGYFDYVNLQMNSKAVLSDSGTITEESSILNFPALNLRETHERPEGMEEASVMMVGMDLERIKQGLTILNDQPKGKDRVLNLVPDYQAPNVSEKVTRIIQSYTDYVNRVVWKKY